MHVVEVSVYSRIRNGKLEFVSSYSRRYPVCLAFGANQDAAA
jgi:hypothetical protein